MSVTNIPGTDWTVDGTPAKDWMLETLTKEMRELHILVETDADGWEIQDQRKLIQSGVRTALGLGATQAQIDAAIEAAA